MYRTTIMLPTDLKTRALVSAHEEGISLGEFIRNSLQARLNNINTNSVVDPFFVDKNYYAGETPTDLALNHDMYLYGE